MTKCLLKSSINKPQGSNLLGILGPEDSKNTKFRGSKSKTCYPNKIATTQKVKGKRMQCLTRSFQKRLSSLWSKSSCLHLRDNHTKHRSMKLIKEAANKSISMLWIWLAQGNRVCSTNIEKDHIAGKTSASMEFPLLVRRLPLVSKCNRSYSLESWVDLTFCFGPNIETPCL